MGADDYIAKPMDIQLLISKIQALLRRSYQFAQQNDQLHFGKVVLNTFKSSLHHESQSSDLTYTELQILISLFQKKGEFVSREVILDYCWQNDQYIDDNTLAVNITRIRKKLKSIDLPDLIQTKKNCGYRLNEASDS